ncbi:gliding motility-associated ABC transporter ATP-binding subunit GldA [Bacteroidota bacterium]
MSIKVEHITKVYKQQKALDDVSFEVGKGQVLGFLGPNGAGKSTMMKIISCFVPQTSGKVEVCGYDTRTHSMDVRKMIGYLPENNPLYYDMYVKEYLSFVAGVYGIKNQAARILDMIDLTGLGVEQHKKIAQLSKGYKQRIGIAQALIHDPQVLILDEPTSGLDPNQLIGIRKLIKELGQEKTVMFSSHIMQEVEAVCDRVIIIDGGKVRTDQDSKMLKNASDTVRVLSVEFETPINQEFLSELSGVQHVKHLEGNKYLITSNLEIDLRAPVSRWAQENQLLILEMSKEEQRLEDVFQKLTSKN